MSENEYQGREITVKIDHSHVEQKVREEKEELIKKLALAEKARDDLETQFKEEAQKSQDEFENTKEFSSREANGVVPLNKTIGGLYIDPQDDPSYSTKRQFSNYSEMIKYLHSEEKKGSEDAHKILNKLSTRVFNDLSSKPSCYSLNSSLSDFLAGRATFKKSNPSDSQTEDAEMLQ
jgi:hypothetical protein